MKPRFWIEKSELLHFWRFWNETNFAGKNEEFVTSSGMGIEGFQNRQNFPEFPLKFGLLHLTFPRFLSTLILDLSLFFGKWKWNFWLRALVVVSIVGLKRKFWDLKKFLCGLFSVNRPVSQRISELQFSSRGSRKIKLLHLRRWS